MSCTNIILTLRAHQFDTRVADSILAASQTCIPRNINNSEKAWIARNLGRQSHCSQRSTTHHQLDSDIADVKSLLNNSTHNMKELKARLKELSERKKEAGKSP